MKHFLLSAAFGFGFVTHALADAAYFHERGNWSVFNLTKSCVATSRPAIETNVSPYMALNLLYELESKDVSVAAYFWPDAFEAGDQMTLGIRPLSGPDVIEIPATAQEHYLIKTDRALSREEIKLLGDNDALIVFAGGSSVQMAVEMDPNLRTLVFDLRSCGRFVEGR